jgi:DHA2 family methylenomycin A resistance protein-like MFS transporter
MDLQHSTSIRGATAFLAIAAGLITFSSLEFMLVEIQSDFSMSADTTIVVSQVASGACLIAVFLAGALADRLGDRRVLVWASGAFCVGAAIVGLSPYLVTLMLGLSVAGIGTIVMAIVGLSILNKTFPAKEQRARAFGMFAVIAPAVSIVIPLLSSAIIPVASWRTVTIVWILVGFVTMILARRTLQTTVVSSLRPELVTPALAGVALAGLALTFSFFSLTPRTATQVHRGLLSALAGVLALAVLVVVMRRLPRPTLDLRSMRARGSLPVLAAILVVNGVNLFFFTYLLLQYRYHQTLFETALILIIPQVTAGIGAILGGRLSARWGSWRVAAVALFAAALASLGAFVVAADSSPWVPIAVLSIAAFPIAAAVGPMTQSFMDLAPGDGAGSASSVRNASVNLGIAVVGLLSGTLVFDELDADTARNLEAYAQQADAFHLAGLLCSCAYVVAAVLLVVHSRRRLSVSGSAPVWSGEPRPSSTPPPLPSPSRATPG